MSFYVTLQITNKINKDGKSLKKGKHKGPDCFTEAYYKTFSDVLASPFLSAFYSQLPPAHYF